MSDKRSVNRPSGELGSEVADACRHGFPYTFALFLEIFGARGGYTPMKHLFHR